MIVQAGEIFRFEQEVWFDGYKLGTTSGSFPAGGEIEIRRGVDGFYYDGTNFVSTPTKLPTTFDATELMHYYDFTIPAVALNGATFNIKIGIVGDPATESVGTLLVRPPADGGSGGSAIAVFDAVDFTTGFPSTVG
jgi:hypothetical protein